MSRKQKGVMHVKGYYQRAKVFGLLILFAAFGLAIYYLYLYFTA